MNILTVIIPTYKPIYIEECIEALYKQTLSFECFEVLIILNGSKVPYYEKISNILVKYPELNVQVLYTKMAGVSNARNLGLKKATGQAICFIDDDDVVSSMYLKEMYRVFDVNSIIVSNVKSFTNTLNNLEEDYLGKAFVKMKNAPFGLFRHRKFLSSACCKAIPMSIISNSQFSLKHNVGEDALFMATLSNRITDIYFTSEDAVYYRRLREGSSSRKRKLRKEKIIERSNLVKSYIGLYISRYPAYNLRFILSRVIASIILIFK